MIMDAKREFLRHTVATLAYRGGKAASTSESAFAETCVGHGCRTAIAILAHIGDLLDWALSMAKGPPVWKSAAPQSWEAERQRFFDGLQRLDDFLASDAPLGCSAEKLFQGPIADALTHVGQIATLRRVAGNPVRGENYFKAEIVVGRVGPEQSSTRVEFD